MYIRCANAAVLDLFLKGLVQGLNLCSIFQKEVKYILLLNTNRKSHSKSPTVSLDFTI